MGSLLAAGCHGVMLLAGRDKKTQIRARELGHCLALAIRARDEKIMFTEDGGVTAAGISFSLATLPVLLHLQRDPCFWSTSGLTVKTSLWSTSAGFTTLCQGMRQ